MHHSAQLIGCVPDFPICGYLRGGVQGLEIGSRIGTTYIHFASYEDDSYGKGDGGG